MAISNDAVLNTLPEGYRPWQDVHVRNIYDNQHGRVNILSSNGQIVFNTNTSTPVCTYLACTVTYLTK